MNSSKHTFIFSNITFGNNSNYNMFSNHLFNTYRSSNESDYSNIVDIVSGNNRGEIIGINEEIQHQNSQTNYEGQNLINQHQTNQNEFSSYKKNEASPYQESQYHNNMIYDTQYEIL